MKYRNQDEGGDLFAFIEHQKKAKANQRSTGIGRLAKIIDWEGFRSDLEDILGYLNRDDSKGGRPPFDPVFMFKVLVLQKFLCFLGLRPGDAIPDANTVWDFRAA